MSGFLLNSRNNFYVKNDLAWMKKCHPTKRSFFDLLGKIYHRNKKIRVDSIHHNSIDKD